MKFCILGQADRMTWQNQINAPYMKEVYDAKQGIFSDCVVSENIYTRVVIKF